MRHEPGRNPPPAPAAPALPPYVLPDAEGARLRVRAAPRASRTEIAGEQGGALRVRLQAPPVDGRANEALCAFVAEAAGVPKGRVAVVSGPASREKLVRVRGVSPERLAEALSRTESKP